jgi:hypothetical protein
LEQNFSIFLSAFRLRKFSGVARVAARCSEKIPARGEPKFAALLKGARVS